MSGKEKKKQKEEVSEVEEVIENLNININILSFVNSIQSQNGIRTKDYDRYIKFCGKKISRIRQDANITQGKRKFNKIEINESNAKENKLILIKILECERKWALGALYNKKLTSLDSVVSQWRYKTKQKFQQATTEAQKLMTICKSRCDETTLREAEAYYHSLNANFLMYVRKYDDALESYKISKDIYSKLSTNKDSIEAFAYKDKVNFIKLQIRFCEYNMTKSNKEQVFNDFEEDNLEEIEGEQINSHTNHTQFEEDAFKPYLGIDGEQEQIEIKYQGTTIPIKNENVKAKFQKLVEFSTKIHIETDITKKLNMFSDVFNLIDDSQKLIKTEKSEKSKDGDNYAQIYLKLINYTSLLKINYQIWKTMILINENKSYYLNDLLIYDLIEKDNLKLVIKPQEMIKLYDNLIQYYSQIKSNEKDFTDEVFFNVVNFKERLSGIFKVFFTGIFYMSIKKYEEANNLINYFKQQCLDLKREYENNKFQSLNYKDLDSFLEMIRECNDFSTFISKKLYVKIVNEKAERLTNIRKNKVKEEGNDKEKEKEKENKMQIKCNSWLYSNLKGDKESINKENFEIFKDYSKISFEEYNDSLSKQTYNNYTHLIQFPPNFQILYPKPISYDLVHSRINYPDMKQKIEKEEQANKGYFGKALSYMFGGKK